jgi:hypothetical protein
MGRINVNKKTRENKKICGRALRAGKRAGQHENEKGTGQDRTGNRRGGKAGPVKILSPGAHLSHSGRKTLGFFLRLLLDTGVYSICR